MMKISRTFTESSLQVLLLATLFLLVSVSATGQELAGRESTDAEVAGSSELAEIRQPNASMANAPIYKDFKGVTIGMEANEVREKLGHLKDKGERQDFFVFSESQSAQIFYHQGKVNAISVDYVGKDGGAPSPESVLGEAVQTRPDGSMYQLKRYPAEGYWVAYSRTAGDSPIVSVTMQKL